MKDHKKRLGHGIRTGWKRIASHPFFRSIDWDSINKKQSQPVYIPTYYDDIPLSTGEEDKFTKQQEDEGVIGWLYGKRRASRQVQNRQSQDLKLLEDKFKSFDYTIFDQYEGFLDERLMTVGPPPHWVKPAFPGA